MKDYDFGGRLKPEQESSRDQAYTVGLPNERMAFVYQRLSTHEQIRRNAYSVQAQDKLEELAKEDGYPDKIIYVERRDLGISGTKGLEDREGLAHLIDKIRADEVESVYVLHMSRLYRDQSLIDAFGFAELCKEHGVVIVTPQFRLNLNDKMHMRFYRMECERAADELEVMHLRLHGGQKIKAQLGRYVGGGIPAGYILDVEEKITKDGQKVDNPNYHKYKIYEPHAEVVRKVFQMAAIPGVTVSQVVRRCQAQGIVLPAFPKDIVAHKQNLVSFANSKRDTNGNWPLTLARVRGMLTNPVYMGYWIWGKKLISKDNHPAIIDPEDFWAVQGQFGKQPHRPRVNKLPLSLSGLLYCGAHEVPKRMTYYHPGDKSKPGVYFCKDEFNATHFAVIAPFLDGPIGEAVVSQCAYPELANQVLDQLVNEYKEVKTRARNLERERKRLEREIENLEENYARARLTRERMEKIEEQIAGRVAKLRELSNLQNTDIGRLVGPAVTQDDVELVQHLLSNLKHIWQNTPCDLQNSFLRLVLNRVTIWHSLSEIRVELDWRAGLKQELVIDRPYFEKRTRWSKQEVKVLKAHFEDMPRDQLMDLIPERSWRQIRRKGKKLGMKRKKRAEPTGGSAYKPWEDEILRQHNQGKITMVEALEQLGERTEDSVRARMQRLGLKRRYAESPEWKWVTNELIIRSPSVLG